MGYFLSGIYLYSKYNLFRTYVCYKNWSDKNIRIFVRYFVKQATFRNTPLSIDLSVYLLSKIQLVNAHAIEHLLCLHNIMKYWFLNTHQAAEVWMNCLSAHLGMLPFTMCNISYIYSWAIKTQHPNEHQYLKDILNILSQRISGDFMNTKGRHHIGFIRFHVKCPNVYTHANFPTVVKKAFSESTFAGKAWLQYQR